GVVLDVCALRLRGHGAVIGRHLAGIGLHDRMHFAAHVLQTVHVAAVGEHAVEPAALPPHEHDRLTRALDLAAPRAAVFLHVDAGAPRGDGLSLVEGYDDLIDQPGGALSDRNFGVVILHQGVLDDRD